MAVAQMAQTYPWEKSYPEGVGWRLEFEPRPLHEMFDESAARFADRPCLDFMGKKWRYAETAALIDRAAKGFQELGVKKGDRVGLMLPNTPFYVVCYFAALKIGGVVVNLNPLYTERELKTQLDDSEVDVLVTLDLKVMLDKTLRLLDGSSLKKVVVCRMADILPFPKNLLFPLVKRKEIAKIPADPRVVSYATLVGNDGRFRPVAIDPNEDLAVLQYTGGTTGLPKAAMLTHANLHANALQCQAWFLGVEPGREKMMGVIPFFHVFAMTVVLNISIKIGAEIVMLPRFDLVDTLKAIQRAKATLFPAVPTIYTAINTYKDRAKYDLTSLKICFSGGAPLPVEVMEEFERTTGCRLVEGYGLSETSPVTNGNPLDGRARAGSIGLPLPGTIVEIVSLDDRKTRLPVGERGEVAIRGPQVMKGYLNKPEDTAHALVDGALHTGDVGYMDEDGYVYIVDRIKDLIICSGFNVYPRMVEEALYLHPLIEECVVAGVPDAYRGQTVKAYVKLAPGAALAPEEIDAFLRDKLSPIELPKLYEFRDELPKTMIGKLSRKALLEEEAQKAKPAKSDAPAAGQPAD